MAKKHKTKIPKKGWKWDHQTFESGYRYDGVHTYEECLLWYTETYPAYAGGGAQKQSFSDFLKNGPSMRNVPKDILDEIYELLEPFEQEILTKENQNEKEN